MFQLLRIAAARFGQELRVHRGIVREPLSEDMGIGREKYNGNSSSSRIGAHPFEDLNPVDDGHLDIKDDNGRALLLNTSVGFGAMLARNCIDSRILKRVTDEVKVASS